MQQISVFLENRSGQLAEITSVLSESNIDLRALNIAETKEYGLLRLITDDAAKTADVLMNKGYLVTKTPVVAIPVANHPGGLNGVLGIIAEAGIDVEYMYSALALVNGDALMIFRVADAAKLEKIMKEKDISVITE